MANLRNIFKPSVDQDVLFALSWKVPDSLEIVIKESDGSYFAKITSFKEDNVVTQADTGQELVEMVNEALYDYLDIPEQYRDRLGFFLPSEKEREELKLKIPKKYLNKRLDLAKA